jgi:hypothetical protein
VNGPSGKKTSYNSNKPSFPVRDKKFKLAYPVVGCLRKIIRQTGQDRNHIFVQARTTT